MDTTHYQQFSLAMASPTTTTTATTTTTRIIITVVFVVVASRIWCDYQCTKTQPQFRSSIIAKEDSGG